jgi:peptidyl-prolyl cis-trans isomerase SurA
MLPPSVGQAGIEIWAVCGRKVLKADDQKREMAQGELRQKEFEILAKKHLKDLRQDAAIEFR